MSIFLSLATFFSQYYVAHETLINLLTGVFLYNLILFLSTIIPFRYPKWWHPVGGMPSDGYRVYLALKKQL
ncbi:hypothetical protein [Sutcliffiella rhizosphaerae]|uniref:Uncharacterized protein n=1 Tax=Sutcliffiella rhizosphaerae TaxID=2880967 RepID=A0ABN8A897_9BACI|nr:hypothetical protein [Sutcliffiella rhizosphaerae]CAG9621330.1 hypothetical protein BACCIP111883_02102 [Sutcliffiella rhizosphaerae]